jgi:hypothetical protein
VFVSRAQDELATLDKVLGEQRENVQRTSASAAAAAQSSFSTSEAAFRQALARVSEETHTRSSDAMRQVTTSFAGALQETIAGLTAASRNAALLDLAPLVRKLDVLTSNISGLLAGAARSAEEANAQTSEALGEIIDVARKSVLALKKVSTSLQGLDAIVAIADNARSAGENLAGVGKEAQSAQAVLRTLRLEVAQAQAELAGAGMNRPGALAHEIRNAGEEARALKASMAELPALMHEAVEALRAQLRPAGELPAARPALSFAAPMVNGQDPQPKALEIPVLLTQPIATVPVQPNPPQASST